MKQLVLKGWISLVLAMAFFLTNTTTAFSEVIEPTNPSVVSMEETSDSGTTISAVVETHNVTSTEPSVEVTEEEAVIEEPEVDPVENLEAMPNAPPAERETVYEPETVISSSDPVESEVTEEKTAVEELPIEVPSTVAPDEAVVESSSTPIHIESQPADEPVLNSTAGPEILNQTTTSTREPLQSNLSVSMNQIPTATTDGITAMAITTLMEFTSDPDYPSVKLSGVSTNDHTMPYLMWRGTDGNIYFAVKSTHELYYMEVPVPGTDTVIRNNVGTDDYADFVFDPWVEIKVDGITYSPDGLKGNTDSSHWTVFVFPSTIFNESGSYSLTVKGIGGGHDVLNVKYDVVIPYVTATLNKTWDKGPGSNVEVLLEKSIDGVNWVLHDSVTLTPVASGDGNYMATYSWTGDNKLPFTDAAGRKLTYRAVEVDPGNNYESVLTVDFNSNTRHYTFTLTNTYVPPKIKITGTKTWNGGTRPAIQLQLYRNGVAFGDPVTLDGTEKTQSFTWEVEKTDIYGKPYTFTVDELKVPENYIKSISDDGLTVTNTYVSPKTTVTGTKIWKGGTRPAIELQLYRNDVAFGDPVKLDGTEGTQSYTWTVDLTDFDGKPYTYRVDEVSVPENYTKSISDDGLTVTNTYASPKTTITGTKIWEGGTRPAIELQLYRNDVALGEPVKMDGTETTQSYTWTVDLTDFDGKPYTYRVDEVSVPDNYTKSISDDGLTVTNTYASPKTTVTGTKIWKGGTRPAIELQLYRNDVAFGEPVKLDGTEATQSYTWTVNLTDFDGKAYIYRVDEVSVPENYTKSISDDGLTVTNTYASAKTTVTGTKIWKGGTRPAIELQLYRDGEALGKPVSMDGTEDTQSYTWTVDLTDFDGKPYTYRVDEVSVPENYTKSISDDGLTVTNTYASPKTTVTGTKIWKGGTRPAIELQLYRNDVAFGESVKLDGTEATQSYSWTVDLTDFDGKAYIYRVDEVSVPENYTKSISDDGLTVTNTYVIPMMEVSGSKAWIGGPKPAIKLQLYRDGEAFGEPVPLNGKESLPWTYTWKVEMTDANGVPYTYSVDEVNVPEDYTKSISEDGLTVTNVYMIPKTDITGTKAWVGGPKPSVMLQLYKNGEPYGAPVTLDGTETIPWNFTWTVDKTDGDGIPFIYTVDELQVPENYVKSISEDGLTVTNTYVIPMRNIEIEKEWIGGPESKPNVTINLLDGDTVVSSVTLEYPNLSYTFLDIPATRMDGTLINYTIEEIPVEGYISNVDGFKVTNDFDEGSRDITVTKEWIGGSAPRPTITIRLFADGSEINSVILPNGFTTFTFEDLPIFNQDGTEIQYTITEDKVEGYTSKITGFKATNTFIEEKLPYTGTGTSSSMAFLGMILAMAGIGILRSKKQRS